MFLGDVPSILGKMEAIAYLGEHWCVQNLDIIGARTLSVKDIFRKFFGKTLN